MSGIGLGPARLEAVRGLPSQEPVILPLASIEYHGPSLPLGSDLLIAECVVSRIGVGYVAPPIPYTSALEHEAYYAVGSQPGELIAYLTSLLASLARHHKCIILAVFHGGAVPHAIAAARAARRLTASVIRVFDFWGMVSEMLDLKGILHGGPIEASILAYCGFKIDGREVGESEVVAETRRMLCSLPGGWLGEECPRIYDSVKHYSRRLGEMVVEAAVKHIARMAKECRGF